MKDFTWDAVVMLPTATPESGTRLADQAQLKVPGVGEALAYDATRDLLYVAAGAAIHVFEHASQLTPQAAAARVIQLANDTVFVSGLRLNAAGDLLYVGIERTYEGQVLALASPGTASGAVTPKNAVTIPDGVLSFAVDEGRSLLYVTGAIVGVHVFPLAGTADGFPVRNFLVQASASGLALDAARDRLYIADAFEGIHVVERASSSAPTEAALLAVPFPLRVTFDAANDRLYVGAYDQGYVLDHASTLTDTSPIPPPALVGQQRSSIFDFAFR